MIRLVLDTNVVVSAVINGSGFEAQVLDIALAGRVASFVTEAILLEYEEVLSRPKFGFMRADVDAVMRLIRMRATLVHPKRRVRVSSDEEDNRFLECAAEARADFLVTGNLRHFPASWGRTRVVTGRQMVELMVDAERG